MRRTSPLPEFLDVRRQQFREFFQPSRIVLGVFHDSEQDRLNAITLCFNMYCSYKPPMMAFSIHHRAYTYGLLEKSDSCVLAVPGESLAEQAMYCGINTAADGEKFKACGFTSVSSKHIDVPGISQALANVELSIIDKSRTGDHLTAMGRVLRFSVNRKNTERCLLSVGPRTSGYQVLRRHGVHRIAVVDDSTKVGLAESKR
jgi:flavin reductase (DIM6/NTAB) family NADH-FMN oxidoreductase RutF